MKVSAWLEMFCGKNQVMGNERYLGYITQALQWWDILGIDLGRPVCIPSLATFWMR